MSARKLVYFCNFLSFILCAFISYEIGLYSGLLIWLLFYPISIVFCFFAGVLVAAFTDYELILPKYTIDGAQTEPEVIEFESNEGVIFSEKVLGKFKDCNIHEYILIDDPENTANKIKCMYNSCVERGAELNVPDDTWFVLLEPGILYTA